MCIIRNIRQNLDLELISSLLLWFLKGRNLFSTQLDAGSGTEKLRRTVLNKETHGVTGIIITRAVLGFYTFTGPRLNLANHFFVKEISQGS